MSLTDNRHCLVCGEANPIGLKTRFTWGDGKAEGRVRIPKNFQGWAETAHGGVVSALLDEAMFYALMSLGWSGMTAELTVRFLGPVPLEEEVVIEAEVTVKKGRFGQAKGRVRHGETILAEATGKFLAPPAPKEG